MNLALLMLLALLWSVVLLPTALRSRQRSLHHSMGGFSHAMHALGGTSSVGRDSRMVLVPSDPRRIVRPPSGAELARERRRRTLTTLLVLAGITTSLALLFGGPMRILSLLTLTALGVFVAVLRNIAVDAQRARDLVDLASRRATADHSADTERRAVGT